MLDLITVRQQVERAERDNWNLYREAEALKELASKLTFERDLARAESADRLAILAQIGWTDQSKHFFALNFSEEQLAIFLEAASLAGETPEEFVVRGCRLLVEGAKA
jgi:hypothetical protein